MSNRNNKSIKRNRETQFANLVIKEKYNVGFDDFRVNGEINNIFANRVASTIF